MIGTIFYHITFKSCIDSILKLGLLPAIELKKMGFEQPYPSDDRYVYLFNDIRMRRNIERVLGQPDRTWLKDKEVLEVMLPVTHPIEREYEQAAIALRLTGEAREWFLGGQKQSSGDIVGSAEDYVRYYFRKTHDIDYAGRFTIKDVCDFIDVHITDDQWARSDVSYRTRVPVPLECLRVVPVDGLMS